jgi:4-hydroxybenzoate polyprenyltransferase
MKSRFSFLQLDEFLRIYQIGFVAVWPLLGFASSESWTFGAIAALVTISAGFNIFGGVLNDIVDIESDRQCPIRADRWLVTGAVSTRMATALVIGQIPLMLAVHVAAGFRASSLGWVATALFGEAFYDFFGKRSRVPPLAEAGQGLAAACLVCYGAACGSERLPPYAPWTATAASAMLLLANSFHGGLRDIEDDARVPVLTTPIWLGCRTRAHGVHISTRMSAYAGTLLVVIVSASLAVASNATSLVFAITAFECVFAFVLFAMLHRLREPAWSVVLRLQLTLLVLPIMTAFASSLGTRRAAVLALIFLAPILPLMYRRLRSGLSAKAFDPVSGPDVAA